MGDIEFLKPHKKGEAPITLAKIKRERPIGEEMLGGLHFKGRGKEAVKDIDIKQALLRAQDLLSHIQAKVKKPQLFTRKVLKK